MAMFDTAPNQAARIAGLEQAVQTLMIADCDLVNYVPTIYGSAQPPLPTLILDLADAFAAYLNGSTSAEAVTKLRSHVQDSA